MLLGSFHSHPSLPSVPCHPSGCTGVLSAGLSNHTHTHTHTRTHAHGEVIPVIQRFWNLCFPSVGLFCKDRVSALHESPSQVRVNNWLYFKYAALRNLCGLWGERVCVSGPHQFEIHIRRPQITQPTLDRVTYSFHILLSRENWHNLMIYLLAFLLATCASMQQCNEMCECVWRINVSRMSVLA